jgi:hypothetical protein
MHDRRIPEWLRHAPAPGVRGFATLAAMEAVARGILVSVFPLAMYRALGDARLVSEVYFLVGLCSLFVGLSVPYLTRYVPRRWLYVAGTQMFAAGSLLAMTGVPAATVAGLGLVTVAVVVTFVCFNAYVLDYIARVELGRLETSRLFYSAVGWTVGPALGVFLYTLWPAAPFVISLLAAYAMLAVFLVMRLGNGRLIVRARQPSADPFAYFRRFFAQSRLIAGWLFAVLRSCGWWVYVVYLPIFAVQSGLGERLGGVALSLSNAALFLSPLMLRFIQRTSVRRAVRTGFVAGAALFLSAGALHGVPELAVVCLMAGSFFLILLDVSAGLPFLLAVKPSERTEMSAIYSSFRDVSGILTPGVAWAVLLVAPVWGVFVAGGAGLLMAWGLAGSVHPRLGRAKVAAQGYRSVGNRPKGAVEPAV